MAQQEMLNLALLCISSCDMHVNSIICGSCIFSHSTWPADVTCSRHCHQICDGSPGQHGLHVSWQEQVTAVGTNKMDSKAGPATLPLICTEGAAAHNRSSMQSAAPSVAGTASDSTDAAAVHSGQAGAAGSQAEEAEASITASGWDTDGDDVQVQADCLLRQVPLC